jgi:hypothetical protein
VLRERRPHGAEQLDEHEHEQERVEHRGGGLGDPLALERHQVPGGLRQQCGGAGQQQQAGEDVEDLFGGLQPPVGEGDRAVLSPR